MFENLKNFLEVRKRKKIVSFLCQVDPDRLLNIGKKNLIRAFRKASSRVPAYKQILKEHGVNPSEIKDVESFKKLIPVITKKDTFERFKIEDLCVDGNLDGMKSIMSSSGFSGIFSIGLNTETSNKNITKILDMGLEIGFNISKKKTLLISMLPMGVKVHTSLPIAETSVRGDMALNVINKFKNNFEQIVIIGDPNFLKWFVEYGIEKKIDWKNMDVSLVCGEDFFSENMRMYLESLIGADLKKGKIVATTMGVAELDLNLLHETIDTIRIRKLLLKERKLYNAFFGKEAKIIPTIMHYYPNRIFQESLPDNKYHSELIFSMLSPTAKIPLLRYKPNDCGKIFQYNELKSILEEYGYGDYVPRLKLPIVALFGRKDKFVEIKGIKFFPEEILEILYSDFEIARSITGNFVINKSGIIEIQLKKKFSNIKLRLQKAFKNYKGFVPKIKLYRYCDFPYQMGIDYERKFRHLY